MCNLLLPNPHLEVDEAILFHLVAHAYEGVHEACHGLRGEYIGWLSSGTQSFFSDFFLPLSESFPGNVELLPQFDAFRVFRLVIVVQA